MPTPTCIRCGCSSSTPRCPSCMAALSLNEEGAYGLGKAKAKAAPKSATSKTATPASTVTPGTLTKIKSIMPDWAWALIAIGGIAVVGGTVYFLTSKRRSE